MTDLNAKARFSACSLHCCATGAGEGRMTIHPFPKSHQGSPSQRQMAVPSVSSLSNDSAGVVHAIEPSGRAEAIPASFLRSDFKRADDTQQDQRHVPILVTNFRSDRVKGRDLITRAEQIRVASIGVELRSANLLALAVQHLGNSVVHSTNYGESEWKLLRKPIPEKSATNQGRGQ